MAEATDSIGLRQGTLRLVPYAAHWPALFEAERAAILCAVPETGLMVEHIGSTAVPGLLAKPILDIAVLARRDDHPAVAVALTGIGYVDRGQRGGRLFIRLRDGDVRTHNLHLFQPGDEEWRRHLSFRDALRADAALREAYAQLKQDIAARLDGRRLGYAEAKTAFIRDAVAGDGAGRLS